ncbi:Rieske 2Fe-2S domain-containing protein [Shewanella corallii]|uniref:Rieske 2Fe-2S domain-containing protein n=1 Tax=Shewanella corallii TaxID=560080 RepID=A0ABT0NAY5_9GAMM|nr:Rieske 2Fe-2S domain-containing protein [Shewanella corallii]MCL2915512.1 Rieske 2Fe-2S domain-containing protein [Shewanella corallii]
MNQSHVLRFLCDQDALAENTNRRFWLDKLPVLLCLHQGEFIAFVDQCPHQMKSLEGGVMRANKLYCPVHGASFELPHGRHLSPPACRGLLPMTVIKKDGKVFVEVKTE